MNTKLGKDIFLEILDAYQKKNITQQEFYTLLNEKETVVISPILSILEMGEFDNSPCTQSFKKVPIVSKRFGKKRFFTYSFFSKSLRFSGIIR